jgi:hypothetical protein
VPLIVAEILLSALVFKLSKRVARLERLASGGGDPVRAFSVVVAEPLRAVVVGGRCDTQSWTRRETLGFWTRLRVFFEEGLVVIIIVGEGE